MCMCTYFLFQRLYICVQLANVFTRNLFPLVVRCRTTLPMMTNEWKKEREGGREGEREKERRKNREEDIPFVSFSWRKRRKRRRREDCPFVPLTEKLD